MRLLILVAALLAAREPVLGPCGGCEAVFEGRPEGLSSSARIAPMKEPGEPMRLEGTVFDGAGKPAAGIVVYAYHTDAKGIYPRDDRFSGDAARHGRLRGWAVTDAQGRYRFDTIRPASYPETRIPAHVHMHVIEPGRGTYVIDDVLFDDDPFLTEGERSRQEGRGGRGIVVPEKDPAGVWLVRRDIRLGERIPGYPS